MDFTTHVEKSNPCTSGESIDKSNLVRPCINITLEHFIKHLQGIPITTSLYTPRNHAVPRHHIANREWYFIEDLASIVKQAAEGVHGKQSVLDEDIVLETEFEREGVKLLTFVGKWETGTSFEEERERMAVREKLETATHEIVKRDALLWWGSSVSVSVSVTVWVSFEHEIPGEDVGVLNLREKGVREVEIVGIGVRKRKREKQEFAWYKWVLEEAWSNGMWQNLIEVLGVFGYYSIIFYERQTKSTSTVTSHWFSAWWPL